MRLSFTWITQRFVLVLFGSGLGVCAVEAVLRVFPESQLSQPQDHIEDSTRPDPRVFALRDEGVEESHSGYRILALGDSFTYGLRLKNSSSWPKLLEQELKQRGFQDIEVLNGGSPGSNTQHQFRFYQKYAHRFRPNMVLVGFLANDCAEFCQSCASGTLYKQWRELRENYATWDGLEVVKRTRLALLQEIMTRETLKEYLAAYDSGSLGYRSCLEAFERFKKRSLEDQFELQVFIYPMLFELSPNHPLYPAHRKVQNDLSHVGVESRDLTPAFYGTKDVELWVSTTDSHPNRKANLIAAKAIADHIQPQLLGWEGS